MAGWEALQRAFADDLKVRGFAVRSQGLYRSDLAAFVAFVEAQGIDAPQDVTTGMVEAYQAHLYEQPGPKGQRLALGTQLHRLAVLRTFFAFLARRSLVLIDPTRTIELPRVPRQPPAVILTRAEVRRFLRAIDTRGPLGVRDRAIFELLYSTGLRASEAAAVTPADLDLVEGYVRVRRGKGGKARVVPVGRIAVRWIRRYLDGARPRLGPQRPLFVSATGRPFDRWVMAMLARKWAQRAGLKKRVTCHVFRHTCATHMLRGRASLRHIQELLGHQDLGSTQIYTRVEVSDLKAVHRRTHPRERR